MDVSKERVIAGLAEKLKQNGATEPCGHEDMIPACKENIWTSNMATSPYLDRVKAGRASRRVSKADSTVSSIVEETGLDLEQAPLMTQTYIAERFADLESRLEDYLDSVAEEVAQDLEREQQHLILMQEQVDKQGIVLQKEVIALHKRLDGETTRRSFVSSEVRGTKEALAEQLEQQSKELAILRARMAELETPIFMRGLRRFFAVWLSGCAPQRNDLLSPISQSKSLVGLPTHTGELEPVLPAKMDVERD